MKHIKTFEGFINEEATPMSAPDAFRVKFKTNKELYAHVQANLSKDGAVSVTGGKVVKGDLDLDYLEQNQNGDKIKVYDEDRDKDVMLKVKDIIDLSYASGSGNSFQ